MSDIVEGPARAQQLAETVLDNLKYQHDWTDLQILTHSPAPTDSGEKATAFSRPMITGLPPRRLYVHPDDQISMVVKKPSASTSAASSNGNGSGGMVFDDTPETEWVLATHIAEKWTVRALAGVFDSLPPELRPSTPQSHPERPKRIVLATVHDDSTVVYYILHDGIVKPRQN
ncbi:tRNA-splicing endonuclease subunit Sen15 [Xylariaceae sp. FL0594]|nr:tRNA-splicing endonuclease subunit Sen15 [Xylariaceae sp. FL0594]